MLYSILMIRICDDIDGKNLPINQELKYEPFNKFDNKMFFGPSNTFGKILDSTDTPLAVIRPCFYETVASGLNELRFLERSGVTVAKHLAFRGPNDTRLLLVEHVLGEDVPLHEVHPESKKLLELGSRVIDYSVNAIRKKRPVLTEIAQPFQYLLRKGEFVLVDLDMVLADNNTEDADKLAAYDIICDFEGSYTHMLSANNWKELDEKLRPLRDIAGGYESHYK